jgi:pimeloyl-ACP methyl ester carboxylesterase
VARSLLIGAAYPDFRTTGIDETNRHLLAIDETGAPDIARIEAQLGGFADVLKAWHSGGEAHWRALLNQTAQMYLGYEGLTAEEVGRIDTPALVVTGDRDDFLPLDLSIKLYRTLPHAELAVCPGAEHAAPMVPDHAATVAALTLDFARRHGAIVDEHAYSA